MTGNGMKAKVLVVEDDKDISLGIRTVLARSGFDVTTSADGKEGLRVFHVSRPDVVVLDIGLPSLDGWGVLERCPRPHPDRARERGRQGARAAQRG
jgi:DNA-binding response OmpR family regulator